MVKMILCVASAFWGEISGTFSRGGGPLPVFFFYGRYRNFFEKVTVEDFGPRVLYRRFLEILSWWISIPDFFRNVEENGREFRFGTEKYPKFSPAAR